MKKILLSSGVAIMLLSLTNSVKAQESATSNLNVHITEQLKVDFGDGNGNIGSGDIDLYFAKPEDYITGVSAVKNGHLLITSTKGYTVDVNTQTANLVGENNNATIEAGAVRVKLLPTNSNLIIGNTTGLNLATAANHFITSAPATTQTAIDVEYFTDPNDQRFVGIAADTYTTKITYTVTAN